MSIYGICKKCKKNEATTNCDKCDEGVCNKCGTVIPVSSSINESLIQVMHKSCAPKKHLAKLEELIIKRGEING